ncbi:MAG: hypothetical protein LUG98_03855 [Tannerellaceae bacterium]|nr:hypothetical protein [Tannerellaceae bacterium]
MATIQRLKTIFSWFEKGKYPTQEQFENTFFSFWHKHDEIPTSAIEDLDGVLNSKYDTQSGEILEQRMDHAEERLDHHDSDIAGLYQGAEKTGERLDEHDVRLDKHEEWLLEHDEEFARQTRWQEKQDNHLAAHDNQFEEVATQFREHAEELAAHQAELDIHTGRLHGIDVELIDHENRLDSHQQELKDHKEILDDHETRLTQAEEQIEDHEGRIHTNEEEIHHLNGAIDDIKSGSIVAGSAHKLETPRKIWGQPFNGEADVTGNLSNAANITATGTVTAPTFAGALTGNATSATRLQTARKIGLTGVTATAQDFNGEKDINLNVTAIPGTLLTGSTTIPTTGNAATATTLANTRKIWGQDFNGSTDVSGNINNAGTISATGNIVTTAGNLFGYNMLEFNRGDACYIHNSHASGYLGLVAAGKVANAANSSMLVTGTTIYPGTTNAISLGTTNNRWSNVLTNLLNVSGTTTLTGAVNTGSIINANDTITSHASNAFILNYGQYKAFLRTDETGFYILVSDLNANSYNSFRPFYINLATGNVNMARPVSISNTLSVTGTSTLTGAVTTGSTIKTGGAMTSGAAIYSFNKTAPNDGISGVVLAAGAIDITYATANPYICFRRQGTTVTGSIYNGATNFLYTPDRMAIGSATNNSSYALHVTGNLHATGNITGTFTGSLSGNATSATRLQTPRTLWGQSFDGTANVTGALTGVTTLNASGNITAPTFVGALSGNATTATTATTATSATQLATARTLWGQSFNGTANVAGALTGVTTLNASSTITAPTFSGNLSGNATTATTATTATSATKLATARSVTFTGDVTGSFSFDGSGNVSTALTNTKSSGDLEINIITSPVNNYDIADLWGKRTFITQTGPTYTLNMTKIPYEVPIGTRAIFTCRYIYPSTAPFGGIMLALPRPGEAHVYSNTIITSTGTSVGDMAWGSIEIIVLSSTSAFATFYYPK